jgi:hypothetical protein
MEMLSKVRDDFLVECADDYVGLWSAVRQVRAVFGGGPPEKVQEATLRILRELLREGLIVAGVPTKAGDLVPWQSPPNETVERIRHEWSALGRDPNIGDIVWFTAT